MKPKGKVGSYEQKELSNATPLRRAAAYKFGKNGLKAMEMGVWTIAQAFRRSPTAGMDIEEATRRLIELMEDSAKTKNGEKLRLLAYAIEAHPICNQHDPLRAHLNSPAIQNFLGLSKSADKETRLKTAEEVQDSIRPCYKKGAVPTLKNIHEVARQLAVTLQRKKPGVTPGVRRKAQNRARP